MRLFGGERMTSIMERVGFTDEQPIESGLVSKSIQRAQSKVEAHNTRFASTSSSTTT